VAIFHSHIKNLSRERGHNTIKAAAYRAGKRFTDARTGEVFNFRRKQRISHTEIIAPPSAPAWAADRQALWNAVEARESRKNARMAKDFCLALPAELSRDQRLALVRRFAQDYTQDGLVVDFCFHDPKPGAQPNFHAHMMVTTRPLTAEGWAAKKHPHINASGKVFITTARARWEQLTNEALAAAGSAARVSAKTLKAQGIGRTPQKPHRRYERAARDERDRADDMTSREAPAMATTNRDDPAREFIGPHDRDEVEAYLAQDNQRADHFTRLYADPEAARESYIQHAMEVGPGYADMRMSQDPERFGAIRRDLDPIRYLADRHPYDAEIRHWIAREGRFADFQHFQDPGRAYETYMRYSASEGIAATDERLKSRPDDFGERVRDRDPAPKRARDEDGRPKASDRPAASRERETREDPRRDDDPRPRAEKTAQQAGRDTDKPRPERAQGQGALPVKDERIEGKIVYSIDVQALIQETERRPDGSRWGMADTMHQRHERAAIMLRSVFKHQYGDVTHQRAMHRFVALADRKGVYVAIDRLRHEPEVLGSRVPTARDLKQYHKRVEKQRERITRQAENDRPREDRAERERTAREDRERGERERDEDA
jgi:hypothetical protein